MIIHGVSTFDGTLLNNRFAHRFLGDMSLPIGNCVSFVSDSTFEILEGEGIYHFCYEIPNVNQFGLVTFHKLLLICIANELSRSLWKYELHDSYSITVEN